MKSKSFIPTTISANGFWKKNMYHDFFSCGYVRNACATAPLGGTAAVTSLANRSGANEAAPVAMRAPQSWPTSTADASPPSGRHAMLPREAAPRLLGRDLDTG